MTLYDIVCLMLLTFSVAAYACDLDGQWYDSHSNGNEEVRLHVQMCV